MNLGTEQTRTQRIASCVIASVALLTALLGLLYNCASLYTSLSGAFDQAPEIAGIPYFQLAFYVMSGICVCCYLVIIACAVGLFRGSLNAGRVLVLILLFEVIYFFAVGSMWLEPTIGKGVAAATGIANGGMMAQFVILLPLWVPVALLAFGLLQRLDNTSQDTK